MTYEVAQKLDAEPPLRPMRPRRGQRIGRMVYPQHKGRMLVMDLESGDYEIDDREIIASERLWERRPDAITLSIRVGYRAAYSRGGRSLPEYEC